jgi:hypothetical protein
MFTMAHPPTLSWIRQIQTTSSQSMYLRSVLTLFSYLCSDPTGGLYSSGFLTKILCALSCVIFIWNVFVVAQETEGNILYGKDALEKCLVQIGIRLFVTVKFTRNYLIAVVLDTFCDNSALLVLNHRQIYKYLFLYVFCTKGNLLLSVAAVVQILCMSTECIMYWRADILSSQAWRASESAILQAHVLFRYQVHLPPTKRVQYQWSTHRCQFISACATRLHDSFINWLIWYLESLCQMIQLFRVSNCNDDSEAHPSSYRRFITAFSPWIKQPERKVHHSPLI